MERNSEIGPNDMNAVKRSSVLLALNHVGK